MPWRSSAPTGCPDENVLAGWARGEGGPSPEWERHLEGCASCRAVLAVVAAEDSGPGATGAPTRLDTGAPTLPELPAASVLSVGEVLGRYRLEGVLGQGGMGVVYAARDPVLERTVALKLLRPGVGGSEARTRLVREAQAMARLAHPHVLPLFELGLEGERVFLVMERVEGATLAEWLTARARPWREVLALLLQAGEGLAAAHRAGLVHRDFKPGNVLVGAEGRPRVTDFGLVRGGSAEGGAKGASPEEALTQAGAVPGTPAYMSPEQLAGREVDARGDQFSFCVTLYEALYGERPFDARARDEATRWRRLPRPARPRLPRALRAALDRGLALRPEARFATLEALLAALRTAAARPWTHGAAAGVGLALVLGGGVALAIRLQTQEEEGLGLARLTPVETLSVDARVGEDLVLSLPGLVRLSVGDSNLVDIQAPEPNTWATTWYTGMKPTTSTTTGTVIGTRQTNSSTRRRRG